MAKKVLVCSADRRICRQVRIPGNPRTRPSEVSATLDLGGIHARARHVGPGPVFGQAERGEIYCSGGQPLTITSIRLGPSVLASDFLNAASKPDAVSTRSAVTPKPL